MPDQVCLVTSGLVFLYNMLDNGRRQIISFKFPGDFIIASQHPFSLQAAGTAELRLFPIASFQASSSGNPRFLSKILDSVNRELSRTYDLLVVVGKGGARAAVASFLLDMDARPATHEADSDLVHLPMLRTDIADYLGLTHETVSRIFTAFKREGLIELAGGRGVRLKNHSLLRALAGKKADWASVEAHD